jgi:hypothetical protein
MFSCGNSRSVTSLGIALHKECRIVFELGIAFSSDESPLLHFITFVVLSCRTVRQPRIHARSVATLVLELVCRPAISHFSSPTSDIDTNDDLLRVSLPSSVPAGRYCTWRLDIICDSFRSFRSRMLVVVLESLLSFELIPPLICLCRVAIVEHASI